MKYDFRTKVFIDTNVLIDVFLQGRPCSHASRVIFEAVHQHLLEGVITTQSLIDANYVLEKNGTVSQKDFFREVRYLRYCFNIEDLNWFDLDEAIDHPTGDFEDDIQFARAKDTCCDYIITGDRHFRQRYKDHPSGIKICTPEEFAALLQE